MHPISICFCSQEAARSHAWCGQATDALEYATVNFYCIFELSLSFWTDWPWFAPKHFLINSIIHVLHPDSHIKHLGNLVLFILEPWERSASKLIPLTEVEIRFLAQEWST